MPERVKIELDLEQVNRTIRAIAAERQLVERALKEEDRAAKQAQARRDNLARRAKQQEIGRAGSRAESFAREKLGDIVGPFASGLARGAGPLAVGFAAAQLAGRVASAAGSGEAASTQEIVQRTLQSLRPLLRLAVVGIIADFFEAYEKRQAKLLDERLARERERNDLAQRLAAEPAFARRQARLASAAFENARRQNGAAAGLD